MHVLLVGSLGRDMGQLGRMMQARGAKLLQADDSRAAIAQIQAGARADLLLVELPYDIAGLVRCLAEARITKPVVACGRDEGAPDAAQAIADGAQKFLPLPLDLDTLAAILRPASSGNHALVARDPAMLALIRRAEQVAPSDATVLITGASGTGKENLARHLHRCSRRVNGPFVALNCAAIPDNLLESELFGHERGAFSGAVARRVGKFEAADGGTLLLDEITEMDVRLQAKLLRVIQERELDRLGGLAPVHVNVRILATSNRDIPAEVAAGRFRSDLYFRLNVVGLHIPALYERPSDIPLLADHYASHYAHVNGFRFRPLSVAAQHALMAHAWPGNVRELENAIHRAVLLASGTEIGVDAFELSPTRNTVQAPPHATIASLVGRTVDDVEQDLILQTLNHTSGNRTHAAHILGISIRALRNKLRDYAHAGAAVARTGVLHAA